MNSELITPSMFKDHTDYKNCGAVRDSEVMKSQDTLDIYENTGLVL